VEQVLRKGGKLAGKFDEYTRNARLKPAFIVTIPVALVCIALGGKTSILATVLITPLTSLGLTALIAQFTRDVGKGKEPGLFQRWGGKPTTIKLRRTDTSLNAYTRARYHEKLQKLMGKRMPSADDEAKDPGRSDKIYETAGDFLREKTRDTEKFRLLFEELMNYGFRRNLWALKPVGLLISCASTALIVVVVVLNARSSGIIDPMAWTTMGLNWLILIWWIFRITPTWVRHSANEYAIRLLSSLDDL
jgi:hypothetical protein